MHFMDDTLPLMIGRKIGEMREPDAEVTHEVLRIILGDPPDPADLEALAAGYVDETINAYIRDQYRATALRLFDETGKEPDPKEVRRVVREKLGLEV